MTTLLLLAALVFPREPLPLRTRPEPIEVKHNVWIIGRAGERIDWGEVTAVCGETIFVDGQCADWTCKRWGVERIGSKP